MVCTAELKTVGDHLRARRITLGLSRDEAAKHLGASVFALADWERGDRSPSHPYWPRIIAFLGYDPHPEPKSLAEELAAVQRREGWTREELAENLGVTPCTVWRWTIGAPPRYKRTLEALRRVGVGGSDEDR